MPKRIQWEDIKREYQEGVTTSALSIKYGVSHKAIAHHARKESWVSEEERHNRKINRQKYKEQTEQAGYEGYASINTQWKENVPKNYQNREIAPITCPDSCLVDLQKDLAIIAIKYLKSYIRTGNEAAAKIVIRYFYQPWAGFSDPGDVVERVLSGKFKIVGKRRK